MRLEIDTDVCEGHGRCYDLVPELFGADAAGRGVVIAAEPTEQRRAAAELAVRSCPEGAITLDAGGSR
jgi:ferredoxin